MKDCLLLSMCVVFTLGVATCQRNFCLQYTCGHLTACDSVIDANNETILTCVCRNDTRDQSLELVWDESLVYCRELCSLENPTCPDNTTCRAIPVGSFRCLCGQGFIRSATGQCVDIDECKSIPNICGDIRVCTNTVGNYTCDCEDGFTLLKDDVQSCAPASNGPEAVTVAASTVSAALLVLIVTVVIVVVWKTRRLRKKTTESSTQLEGQSNEISDQRHESIDNTVLPSLENDAASTSGRVGVPTLSTPGYIDMQNLSGGRNENANSECLRRDLAENTKDMSKASYVSMKGVMPNRRKQTYQNVKKGKMSKWEIQTNKATATCIGEDALEESVYANDISEELYANT